MSVEPSRRRLRRLALRRFEPIEKGLGARARNRAERLYHLLAAHADAVVLDGEGPLVGIDGECDARLDVIAEQRRLGDRVVAQPLAGVGGIRDQLAQEYGFVGIDRMHHQVQQLGDIGLERPALRFVLLDRGHGRFPARHLSGRKWSEAVADFKAGPS